MTSYCVLQQHGMNAKCHKDSIIASIILMPKLVSMNGQSCCLMTSVLDKKLRSV